MKKYKIGLLVGRFQPFHLGHLWLIKHALQSADKLIIGVGSANIKNHDNNFLTYRERKKMLEIVSEKENLKDKIIKIVPLNDYYNDEVWFKKTIEKTGPVEVIAGNNQWTNGIFEARGYPILRVGFYKRYIYEGKRIRRLMKEGKKWQNRVPDSLILFWAGRLTISTSATKNCWRKLSRSATNSPSASLKKIYATTSC